VFVCILSEKAVPEMTYTVSGLMLNPTHSLTGSHNTTDTVRRDLIIVCVMKMTIFRFFSITL